MTKESMEKMIGRNLREIVEKEKALGGATVLIYQANPEEKGMGVAMQIPVYMRGLVPSLFREIAFQCEQQNLMAHIPTEELKEHSTEVLQNETRKIS